MSEFTGEFKFVCEAYMYHREGDEIIEEHGKIFHKNAFLSNERWIPGDTYFLTDNGEQRRCTAKHYLLQLGYMWMPFSNIKTAKNVFRMHDRFEDYRNTQKVRYGLESMRHDFDVDGAVEITDAAVYYAKRLCNGDFSKNSIEKACVETFGYIGKNL